MSFPAIRYGDQYLLPIWAVLIASLYLVNSFPLKNSL